MDDGGCWWRRSFSVPARLSAMMALVYAVQGAWWPLLTVHLQALGVTGRGQGLIFATMAIAALATPLGFGHLADRRWPTQKLLAAIYGIGTILLVVIAIGPTRRPAWLFLLFLAYWLLTAPALGLCASLAFRNLTNPRGQFGSVRLWGTVGWMVVGWLVSGVMALLATPGAGAGPALWVGVALSAITSAYCLTLPHTPPLAKDGANLAEGLETFRRPQVLVFLLSAFAVFLTSPYMYQVLPPYLRDRGVPVSCIPLVLTLGQMPEIAALAVMPWIMGRLGYRGTLALGIGAWALRFGSLAFDPPMWVAIAGITLHGVAIASFHIGGQLYLDSQAPAHRRAGAQGVYMLVTSGLGSFTGNVMAGELFGLLGGQYGAMFLVPGLINLANLALFLVFFRPGSAGDPGRSRATIANAKPLATSTAS